MATNNGMPPIYVNLLTNTDPTFKVATDVAFTQNVEHFLKETVTSFKAVYNGTPSQTIYPYPTQTEAHIYFNDGRELWWELQRTANHNPAWTAGTQASCTQFESDFAAAMPL